MLHEKVGKHGEEVRAASRTTGKKAFAAPQARKFLSYHRQGFCNTTGKMAFAAAQRANNILAAPDQSMFLLTDNKSIKDQQ